MHYYVIAGNMKQHRAFVDKKTAEAIDQNKPYYNFYYVTGPDALRGVRNPKGYFIGTWRDRADIRNIITQFIVCADDADKRNILYNCMKEVR
jgi:hypothetical protein